MDHNQIMVTINVSQDDDEDVEHPSDFKDIDDKADLPAINVITPTFNTPTLVPRRYEFQPPNVSTSSSLLGAGLSSSSVLMAPPKLNNVKKSRILVNPGKSMVEWMKIQQDLSTKGSPLKLRKIGPDELARHNTLGDVWMTINDRVFDVSDYVNYHPGGVEEIMKGAGQDATTMFNQIHRWVNFESILRGNLLGFLIKEPTLDNRIVSKIGTGLGLCALPSTKFSEDDDSVFLEIDSHLIGDIRQESWTVGILNRERLILKVMVKPPKLWMSHLQLVKALTDDKINVDYENNYKRVLITLKKPKHRERWLKLGEPLSDHNQLQDSRTTLEDMYPTKLIRREKLTRNSYLFTTLTHNAVIGVPVGFHVQIRLQQNVTRPFSPISLFMDEPTIGSDGASISQNSQELHFIIKVYQDGQFTSSLENLYTAIKDGAEVAGINVDMGFPRGNFDPTFLQDTETLCLLAGGSGITPFIRIIEYLYRRRESIPIQRIVLLFFNETAEDIIWQEKWTKLTIKEPSWFYFYPVISKPTAEDNWNGLTGRISIKLFENCIKDCAPMSIGGAKAIICGSNGFNASCKSVLKEQTVLRINDPSGIFIFNG